MEGLGGCSLPVEGAPLPSTVAQPCPTACQAPKQPTAGRAAVVEAWLLSVCLWFCVVMLSRLLNVFGIISPLCESNQHCKNRQP